MEADVQAGLPRNDDDDDDDDAGSDADALDLGQNAFGQSGEAARKAIIRGDLVITVLGSAFTNRVLGESLDFHLRLVSLFRRYPTGLRHRLLETVYAHMEQEPSLRWNPVARRTVLERTLFDAPYDPETEAKRGKGQDDDVVVLQGEQLVGEIGRVVKALRAKEPEAPEGWERAWNEEVGMWLLRWADKMADNQDLVSSRLVIPFHCPLLSVFAASVPRCLRSALDETHGTPDGETADRALGLHRLARGHLAGPSIPRQTARPREKLYRHVPGLIPALDMSTRH